VIITTWLWTVLWGAAFILRDLGSSNGTFVNGRRVLRELQLRDAAGILELRGGDLDVAYIERWIADLGLEDLWRRLQAG